MPASQCLKERKPYLPTLSDSIYILKGFAANLDNFIKKFPIPDLEVISEFGVLVTSLNLIVRTANLCGVYELYCDFVFFIMPI